MHFSGIQRIRGILNAMNHTDDIEIQKRLNSTIIEIWNTDSVNGYFMVACKYILRIAL